MLLTDAFKYGSVLQKSRCRFNKRTVNEMMMFVSGIESPDVCLRTRRRGDGANPTGCWGARQCHGMSGDKACKLCAEVDRKGTTSLAVRQRTINHIHRNRGEQSRTSSIL